MAQKMHPDELDIDDELVRRLLASQLLQWSEFPLERVVSTGTDNAMYRLGREMVARLPLQAASAAAVEKEHRWLPVLASRLPFPIPVPLAVGEPTAEYPVPWTVYPWFRGEDATIASFDQSLAASDVARFISALTSIDTTGAPVPHVATLGRGVPLVTRDEYTRTSISKAGHLIDTEAVAAAWDQALQAPSWDQPPVWVHGDIASGNLLFDRGRLSAVIDFATMGIGDPACDLMVAWELFDSESREILRNELEVDDATWERSRGWALSNAVGALPYYEETNPFMAAQARHKLDIVLNE